MIRRALVKFFKDYRASIDQNGRPVLTSREQTEIESFVTSNEFHFILRNQIVMNPIPKRLKKQETVTQRGPHETNFIQGCLIRVSYIISLYTSYYKLYLDDSRDGDGWKGIISFGDCPTIFQKNEDSTWSSQGRRRIF